MNAPAGARGQGSPALPWTPAAAARPGRPRRSRGAATLRSRHGPAPPETQARNSTEAPREPGSRRPPAGPPLRSPETPRSEGDPNSSEEHAPVVKEEPLLPPGTRNMCSVHSWCGLQLASPGPAGPTRGGRSVSRSSL